jgi:hypothetical protein
MADRMWASWLNCDSGLLSLAKDSMRFNEWEDRSLVDLVSFSEEAAIYSKRCGRVGGLDMHAAVSNVDNEIFRRFGSQGPEFDARFCFGVMISLMNEPPDLWGDHLRVNAAEISYCEALPDARLDWLLPLFRP